MGHMSASFRLEQYIVGNLSRCCYDRNQPKVSALGGIQQWYGSGPTDAFEFRQQSPTYGRRIIRIGIHPTWREFIWVPGSCFFPSCYKSTSLGNG